jgi:Tol biopolymer transport system component
MRFLIAAVVTVAPFVLAALLGAQPRPKARSLITIIDRDGSNKRVVFTSDRLFEAPNWSPDGKYLLLNSEGKLWKIAVEGGEPQPVELGRVNGINNDHGISFDGTQIVVSARQMYVLPSAGGEPKQITEKTPSYFHGWAPDGKSVVYCAERDGNFDIYRIPITGGAEERLTVDPAYDDGPEYTPDGKWIYWNSDRSGSWDIWRMPATGAGPHDQAAERVTSDEMEDWFPHISPDGKWIVFLSFPKGTKGHPPNQNVVLRMMPAPGDRLAKPEIREVVHLFGGQGTLNVHSWSPDSGRFAYVSYELTE